MNNTETYRQTAQEMLTFIEKSPSCYHAIANIKDTLSAQGFRELAEKNAWKNTILNNEK